MNSYSNEHSNDQPTQVQMEQLAIQKTSLDACLELNNSLRKGWNKCKTDLQKCKSSKTKQRSDTQLNDDDDASSFPVAESEILTDQGFMYFKSQ